jgi:hypothetical protein
MPFFYFQKAFNYWCTVTVTKKLLIGLIFLLLSVAFWKVVHGDLVPCLEDKI